MKIEQINESKPNENQVSYFQLYHLCRLTTIPSVPSTEVFVQLDSQSLMSTKYQVSFKLYWFISILVAPIYITLNTLNSLTWILDSGSHKNMPYGLFFALQGYDQYISLWPHDLTTKTLPKLNIWSSTFKFKIRKVEGLCLKVDLIRDDSPITN